METASSDFRHETPDELRRALAADDALKAKWHALTSLARNEWICWLMSAKKQDTRSVRLVRLQEEILDGKRRPYCWPGCPHRSESARKWFRN